MPQSFYELACDKDFWIKLNPDLQIEGTKSKTPWSPANLSKDALKGLKKDIVQHGYFISEPVLDPIEMAKLADSVKLLALEQWPAIFAMVYDEFWQVYQHAAPVLNYILDSNYRQLPNFWVYYLAQDQAGSDLAPHRDRCQTVSVRKDGMPNSMTIWIALNDSTFELGLKDLQSVRTLPCKAGSILSWNESLIHWGSKSSDKAFGPRISVACAFQRADVAPLETPILDPFVLPCFKTRLGIIGQQLFPFALRTGMPEAVQTLSQELSKLSQTIQVYDQNHPYKGVKAGQLKVAK